jgi:hypothetical protein
MTIRPDAKLVVSRWKFDPEEAPLFKPPIPGLEWQGLAGTTREGS